VRRPARHHRPRTAFGPAGADFGFREPLTPHLARPGGGTVAEGTWPRGLSIRATWDTVRTLRRLLVLLVGLVALALVPSALAHKPVFGGEDRLLDAVTSYARYSSIDRSTPSRRYRVRVGAERRLLVEVLIPDRAPENRLPARALPRVVVLGADGRRWTLPPARTRFDEPFTRTRYLTIGRREISGLPPGVYELVVSGATSSRFVLVTGSREDFGVGDVAKLALTIARVQTWYRDGPTDPPGRIGAAFWLIPVIAGLLLATVLGALGWAAAVVARRIRRGPRRDPFGPSVR